MLRSLFGAPQPSVPRGVHVYLGPDAAIVAATHQNLAGIYYEQADPQVLRTPIDPAQLGAAFRQAFDRFSVQDKNLRDARRSDWPAYQASGLRSLKDFERTYQTVLCYALNPSNAVVRASIAHPAHEGIELSCSFNPLLAPEVIGAQLLQLAKAAAAARD